MDKIKINGGKILKGKIQISGAKNAALPIMAASLLTKDTLVLSNVPRLSDVSTMADLLMQHGTSFEMDGTGVMDENNRTILLNSSQINNKIAPYDIVRKMRASIWVLGPLLARFGEAYVSLPGGCAIGPRPIDLHLDALTSMGASINLEDGYIKATVKDRLIGCDIYFDKISVGATINTILAATLADGITTLYHAACEPEIGDLIDCLISMGAKIKGKNSTTLTIEGVEQLHGAHHHIIADRIEAGTYAIAAAITRGEIELLNINYQLMDNILEKLSQSGVGVLATPNGIKITADKSIKAIDITTQPYPGFPTDLQAQFMSLMTLANGVSTVAETVFENRFMHVPELIRMGANITINNDLAVIKGVSRLKSAQVMATDLRASVSLVLAALAAKGETIINRVYHIDRGYERIEEKLSAVGAEITRVR